MVQNRSRWDEVTDMMDVKSVSLGRYLAYWFDKSPRRTLHYMSYYKFASKIIGKNKRVLDIGCSEGLGTYLLAKECGFATGIDLDEDAINTARSNWDSSNIEFICNDFFSMPAGSWDAIVSFDVIEHIFPKHINRFWKGVLGNLETTGITIIGTPNETSQIHASSVSKKGHVNVYSMDRLEEEMGKYFHHIFCFGANDEIVHTGFHPMLHYLFAIGCKPRKSGGKECK